MVSTRQPRLVWWITSLHVSDLYSSSEALQLDQKALNGSGLKQISDLLLCCWTVQTRRPCGTGSARRPQSHIWAAFSLLCSVTCLRQTPTSLIQRSRLLNRVKLLSLPPPHINSHVIIRLVFILFYLIVYLYPLTSSSGLFHVLSLSLNVSNTLFLINMTSRWWILICSDSLWY